MAKEVDVFFYRTADFLTEIELDDNASANSTLAYAEYLKIVYSHSTGISRILTLGRIFIRALIVIPTKIYATVYYLCIKKYLKNVAQYFFWLVVSAH